LPRGRRKAGTNWEVVSTSFKKRVRPMPAAKVKSAIGHRGKEDGDHVRGGRGTAPRPINDHSHLDEEKKKDLTRKTSIGNAPKGKTSRLGLDPASGRPKPAMMKSGNPRNKAMI